MKFGIHLGTVNAKFWGQVTEEADRLGFESVWVPEHVVVPLDAAGSPHHGAEHPPIPSNIPIYDALGVLCFLAARTDRIHLGTNVFNIGLRHPFLTARAATTADVLSSGRLELGIGASWLHSEWTAMGLDFDGRGTRIDECIDVCQRLWTEETVEHHGAHFDFGPTAFEPKPVQVPLPLHIGGDGAAALRRAATVGTGWMPMNHTLADLPPSIERLRELTETAGRPMVEITVPGDIATDEDLEAHTRVGVDRVIVRPWANSRDALGGMERFAETFLG